MAKAANNLGALLEMRGELGEALRQYKAAVAADAGLPQALSNLGSLYARLGDRGQALEWLRRALALAPGDVGLLCRLGESCVTTWRLDEALEHYRAALAVDPGHWPVHFGLGNTLQALGLTEQAEASFRRVLELGADLPEVHSNLLLCMHYHRGNDPEAMFAEHLTWARRYGSRVPRVAHSPPDPAQRRLNIGYVSPNFMQHAVAWAIEPVFAAHDREAFQVFFYSNVAEPDATTQRFMKLCDHWRDVHAASPAEEARLVREDRIDILVDLAVHTGGGRPMLFARKPAPVQVNWQGYPNTSGLAEVGYRITDEYADPPGESDRHHSEVLVRLDCGFFCYAPPPDAPDAGEPPSLAGGHITFGCFNNLAKVTPATLDLWSKLLHRVPGSRMFMKAHGLGAETARRNVLEHFARNGISAQRVRLLGPEDSHSGHLARYNEVDIALDPFPYHGTATTCEALWMGVPVVTLAGRTHVARVGVSILQRIGVPELIASTEEEYVALAAGLAGDLRRLRALRGELRSRLRNSSLLDSRRFARSLEAAYRDMWDKHCAAAQMERIVEIRGGVRMCVPAALETASTYVLLEQEDWFEDEIHFVRRYLQPGMHAVDVGANVGVYTGAMAARVGAGGRVWSFEPTPRSGALLQRMLDLNGFRHVTLVRSAVSDRQGSTQFQVTSHSELNAVGAGGDTIRVDTVTLDHAAREHGWREVAFVKIDVEGHEAAVIAGAREFLAAASPLVQFEVRTGTEFDLRPLDALSTLGYRFYRLLPHRLVLVPFDRAGRLDGYQLNLFACKPDRAARLAGEGLLVEAVPAADSQPGEPYPASLEAYRRSVDEKQSLSKRVASLRQAFDFAIEAVRQQPTLARRMTLARIAWEFGERTVAVANLEKAVALAKDGAAKAVVEPHLNPSPRYEAMAPQGEPGEWLESALVEACEKLRTYSSLFAGATLAARLEPYPWRSPEMERRRQLVALRAGTQPAPQATPLVATRSEENLNPEYWGG
jgi:FkbM family methyltransferase